MRIFDLRLVIKKDSNAETEIPELYIFLKFP